MKNIKRMVETAKKNAPDTWLINAKEVALNARQSSGQFEKLPRLDARALGGSADEPVVVLLKALSGFRQVKTDKMTTPMEVADFEIVKSNIAETEEIIASKGRNRGKVVFEKAPLEEGKKYGIWLNTTVLAKEFAKFIGATLAKDATSNRDMLYFQTQGRDITGETFLLCSYGMEYSQSANTDIYIFRVLKNPE